MVEAFDDPVLDRLLREGQRQLVDQKEHRESILRRAAELVRLGIAILGGVVVIAGLVVASDTPLGADILIGLFLGVMLVVVAVGELSALIAGVAGLGLMITGPDLRTLAAHWSDEAIEFDVIASLALGLPDFIQENGRSIARMGRIMGLALSTMAAGTMILLVAFVYMLGGGIHV